LVDDESLIPVRGVCVHVRFLKLGSRVVREHKAQIG
jgi:hypothetical protein